MAMDGLRDMPITRADTTRMIVASTIGNGVEWYDFISYAYFTPFIAKAFFPSDNEMVSLILTWATFGLGIVVRPIAGAVLGVYADRVGRRVVLSTIILAMALGMLIMAVTPTYASIGIAAPLLIIAARILQGVAVTGEYSSGIALLVEYAPPGQKFVFGSFQMVSQAFALALSCIAALVVTKGMADHILPDWAWRVPFLLGVVVGPIGFYIRRKVAESPEFVRLQQRRGGARNTPFTTFLRDHGRALLATLGATIPGTVVIYLWFLYVPAFAMRQLHIDAVSVNLSTAACGVGLMVLCPIAGALCDRSGGYRFYVPAVFLMGALAYPMFAYLVAAPSAERLLAMQIVAMLIMAFIWGPFPQLSAAHFPTGVRSTGLGLMLNLTVALFGGLAPLEVTSLLKATGNLLIPAYYIMIATLISLVVMAASGFGRVAHATA